MQFKALSPKGGDKYNIIKMSRAERKRHNFERKDPLAHFSDEEIKKALADGSLAIVSM